MDQTSLMSLVLPDYFELTSPCLPENSSKYFFTVSIFNFIN